VVTDQLTSPAELTLADAARMIRDAMKDKSYPKDHPSPQAVWRWFKRLKQDAGLPLEGGMHEARHTFAMELRRVAGLDAASHALGHADLSTTLGIYGHRDDSDLETAMDAYAEWLERQERSVPPEGES
jgi:integrase